MGFFFRFEMAKRVVLAIRSYFGAPTLQSSDPMYASVAGFVVLRRPDHITHILRVAGRAQVIPSIVRRVSVFVINAVRRPLACHVSPDDNVSANELFLEADCHSAVLLQDRAASDVADLGVSHEMIELLPAKFPSPRVIRKVLSYQRWMDVIFEGSHTEILNFPATEGKF
jgi:hypothetical protein